MQLRSINIKSGSQTWSSDDTHTPCRTPAASPLVLVPTTPTPYNCPSTFPPGHLARTSATYPLPPVSRRHLPGRTQPPRTSADVHVQIWQTARPTPTPLRGHNSSPPPNPSIPPFVDPLTMSDVLSYHEHNPSRTHSPVTFPPLPPPPYRPRRRTAVSLPPSPPP